VTTRDLTIWIDQNKESLLRFCKKLSRNSEAAEDIFQTTCLNAFKLVQKNPPEHIKAWFYQGCLYNFYNYRVTNRKYAMMGEAEMPEMAQTLSTEQQMCNLVKLNTIHQAIEKLTPGEKKVIKNFYFSDDKAPLSESAKVLKRLALIKLRKNLKGFEPLEYADQKNYATMIQDGDQYVIKASH